MQPLNNDHYTPLATTVLRRNIGVTMCPVTRIRVETTDMIDNNRVCPHCGSCGYASDHVETVVCTKVRIGKKDYYLTDIEYVELNKVLGTPEEITVLEKFGIDVSDIDLIEDSSGDVPERRAKGMSTPLAVTIGFIVGAAVMWFLRLGS